MVGLLRSVDRGHAFAEEDVPVFTGFSGKDDSECRSGFFVEGEAVDAQDRGRARRVFLHGFEVVGFDAGIERIAFDRGHHGQRVGDVGVELEEREQAVEQGGDFQAVGAQDAGVAALCREVRVGEHDLITMAHTGEGGEEFRGKQG